MSGSDGRSLSDRILGVEEGLAAALVELNFGKDVAFVYNPLDYASEPHRNFVRKYLRESGAKVLFLGMNPGPFGMAQTGVPFGQVEMVKDFLDIDGAVLRPESEHPKRPVEGFLCKRSEVSGERFWSLIKDLCQTPEAFFRHCFVYNYCPLLFLAKSGKNVTPSDMKSETRAAMARLCDDAVREIAGLLGATHVVGIGKFAEDRARKLFVVPGAGEVGVEVAYLMHPSPASPVANKGWANIARRQLEEQHVLKIMLQ